MLSLQIHVFHTLIIVYAVADILKRGGGYYTILARKVSDLPSFISPLADFMQTSITAIQ